MKVKHLAAHPDAIPTLSAWVYNQWRHWMSADITSETLIKEFEKRTIPGCIPEAFIAVEGNEPLGTASLVIHDMAERRDLSPWLAAVYVAPEFRNQGIGSVLVQTVMDEARKMNVEKLYLFTPDKMSFYGRLGWQILEHTKHQGTDVTVMVYEF